MKNICFVSASINVYNFVKYKRNRHKFFSKGLRTPQSPLSSIRRDIMPACREHESVFWSRGFIHPSSAISLHRPLTASPTCHLLLLLLLLSMHAIWWHQFADEVLFRIHCPFFMCFFLRWTNETGFLLMFHFCVCGLDNGHRDRGSLLPYPRYHCQWLDVPDPRNCCFVGCLHVLQFWWSSHFRVWKSTAVWKFKENKQQRPSRARDRWCGPIKPWWQIKRILLWLCSVCETYVHRE